MTPRFTPTQAKLVLEDAGLDPGKPLSEQLGADDQTSAGLEQQVAALTDRVTALTATLEATQADPARDFATDYATALGQARSKWFTPGGEPDAA